MALDNPHDKFFKASFSRKDVVAALIENRFPEPLRKRLDVSTLELTNSSFVDDELSEHFADLVYECTYSGEKSVKIALLIEHKSYQEDYPHLQLLRYLLNVWQEDRKQNRKLTPVIPLVIYHGQGRWKYAPLPSYFAATDNVLEEFIPDFHYLLHDLSAWPDKEILAFQNRFLALATFLLKHSRAERFLESFQSDIRDLVGSLAAQNERNFIESVFVYVFRMENGLTREEVLAIFRQVSPQTEEIIMSAYEQTLESFNFEVIKRALQKGLQVDTIAAIVNLPVQKVEGIIEKIKKGLA
ncbi:MAG: Rpn family recombination-promoting nuclease/putative transposase [Spirosomataceae bacterium]